jgi:hypothetical protein
MSESQTSKTFYKSFLGFYLAIAIAVTGYFYINPSPNYYIDSLGKTSMINGFPHVASYSYKNFKYSLLIFTVLGILILSFIQLYRNKTKPNG